MPTHDIKSGNLWYDTNILKIHPKGRQTLKKMCSWLVKNQIITSVHTEKNEMKRKTNLAMQPDLKNLN